MSEERVEYTTTATPQMGAIETVRVELPIAGNPNLTPKACPLPIDVFPNRMGINLASIKSIAWEMQSGNQLKWIKINFIPYNQPEE